MLRELHRQTSIDPNSLQPVGIKRMKKKEKKRKRKKNVK